MDRRTFTKVTSMGTLGVAVLPACMSTQINNSMNTKSSNGTMTLNNIGIQLYTVRDQMQQDVQKTLETVAKIGYTELEFAGYFEIPPTELRKRVEDLGMKAVATHVGPDVTKGIDTEKTLEDAIALGCSYLVVPWLPGDERKTADDYKMWSQRFNELGEACSKKGLTFCYHNHAFEFDKVENQLPFDILLKNTDPDKVSFELDLFWMNKGGYNPLDYFQNYPQRFALCHAKDMGEKEAMVDVGSGYLDFASYFSNAEQAGLKHYFVEHDQPRNSLISIENSFNYLQKLRF